MSVRLWVLSALVLGGFSLAAGNAYAGLTATGPLEAPAQTQFKPIPVPVRTGEAPPPAVSAAGVLIVDAATMTPLFEKEPDKQRPIASITKLATVMSVLDHRDAGETITIPALPAYHQSAETLGLASGQKWSVGDLVKASLIPSANDAADALAVADAGSMAAFTAKMNAKLEKWGIEDARFSTASGLVEDGNQASPRALAKLAKLALASPTIRETISTRETVIQNGSGQAYTLKTTNQLLADSRFRGIKTGYTPLAGQCFLGLAEINGRQVITVVLGSSDRFGDTQRLADWVGQNYQWVR